MSYNCCIGQDPPSPESYPSRPVKPPIRVLQTSSWSTASRMSRPEDIAELQVLFRGDSQDIGEGESRAINVKRSSSTLDAVKSKLLKHLSRESGLPKHLPRSTVGHSDEEILRRKELRLIRDRRIKEELSSEIGYDDDAKSMTTLATEDSPYKKPQLTDQSEVIDSVVQVGTSSATPLVRWKSYDQSYVRKHSSIPTLQHSHSLAILDDYKTPMWTTKGPVTCRSVPDFSIPPAPVLKPQRMPSIADSAIRRTSWRLSFTADQRAGRLRALSQECEPPLSIAASGTGGIFLTPLRWFRGQGIHLSPLAPTETSLFPLVLDNLPSQVALDSKRGNCESVDGSAEAPAAPISLLDMRISKRLASRGLHSHSSSPQLSSWDSQSHYPICSYNSEVSIQKAQISVRRRDSVSTSCGSNHKLPLTRGDVLWSDISSVCAPRENHVKNTSEASNFSTHHLLISNQRMAPLLRGEVRGKNKSPFILLSDRFVEEYSAPRISPIIAAGSTPNQALKTDNDSNPSSRDDCQSVIEFSMPEIIDLQKREVELHELKITSPKSESSQTSCIQSKFNEGFDKHNLSLSGASKGKLSLSAALQLPRFAKLVVRSYDGVSPFELQVPGREGLEWNFSNRSHSSAGMLSPGAKSPGTKVLANHAKDLLHTQDDETADIWSKAFDRTQEEYGSQLKFDSSSIQNDLDNRNGSFLSIKSLSRKLKGKGKANMVSARDMDIHNTLKLKSVLISNDTNKEAAKANEWAEELAARERQARAKTTAISQSPLQACSRKSPESWARFPSHTREERTTSAGVLDHVIPKDFAIKDMKDGVIEWITTGRKYHHHHHEKEQHHSLPIRVSRQIRASLYRLRTTKNTASSDVVHGRKGSVSIGGNLEYPELELLAGEIAGEGLYEEIERGIEEGMRNDERAARKVVFGGGANGEVEESEISIADPRFYDDCIIRPTEDDDKTGTVNSNTSC